MTFQVRLNNVKNGLKTSFQRQKLFFSLSLEKRPNKLECLSLASLCVFGKEPTLERSNRSCRLRVKGLSFQLFLVSPAKYKNGLERFTVGKRSTLFGLFFRKEKKFFKFENLASVIQNFFLSLCPFSENKLECLFLTSSLAINK